jgi:hypothetical protein
VPDYLAIQWTASGYSAALYAAPGSYGTVLSFVEPAESGTTSAGLYDVALDSCVPYRRGGIPELRFSRLLGALTALPDPWMGQQCAWFHGTNLAGATCYFTGDIVNYVDRHDHDLGWTRDYRALGLRNRADWIPVTDSNTLSDAIRFNMPANNLSTIMSREGRTVGQAVLDVLSGYQNQAWLGGITGISSGYGLGNYTSQGYGGSGQAVMGGTIGTNHTTVASITVTNGGSGYTTAPTVVIAGPCRSQAQAYATVGGGGAITSFTVTYAGSGYQAIPAVIVSNLPAATVNDCAALNVIAPFTLAFAGERILSSVESVTQTCHPNHWLSVDPIGNIRILDQRQNTVSAITLNGSDPRWSLPQMTRDTSETYSEVIVRGGPNVVATTLAVKQWPGSTYTFNGGALTGSVAIPSGGLIEDFAFGSYTSNAAAKAAWTPAMYQQLSLQGGQDQGSLTCGSTTSVTLTSTMAPSYVNWTLDQLDQTNTGLHAVLTVINDVDTNIQQIFMARIIANTATTSGGTAGNSTTVTLDQPLPNTNYNSYRLYALSPGGNVVYRRYKVTNPFVAHQMQQYFPYPFAFSFANNSAAVMTSAPLCNVFWSATGNPPYNMSSIAVIIDPDAGTITTVSPTSLVFGGGVVTPPTDVQVFLPVANGSLEVFAPAAAYFTGTSALIEGIDRIKVVTCRDWTDYSNTQTMQAYANELLQSMCDVVLEGSTSYLGLATAFLSPAQAVQITGSTYTTGWEGGGISNPQIVSGGSGYSGTMTYTITGSGAGGVLSSIVTGGVITSVWVSTRGSGYTGAVTVAVSGSGGGSGASITLQSESLPVASMDVRFQPGPGGTSYVSTLHLSNRRAKYTSAMFVRPPVRGQRLGGAPLGAGYYQGWAAAAGTLREAGAAAAAGMMPSEGELGTDSPDEREKTRDEALDARSKKHRKELGTKPTTKQEQQQRRAENEFMEGRRREVARADQERAPEERQEDRRARAAEHAAGGSYAERRYGAEQHGPEQAQPATPPPVAPSNETLTPPPDDDASHHLWARPSEPSPPPTPAGGPAPPPPGPRGPNGATFSAPEPAPAAAPAAAPPPAPPPAPAPAPAPATSDQPQSPAEWLKHYQDKQAVPDEATAVMEAERKAAQQAGQSVTGKAYVPTLEEALDNPINPINPQ